MKTGVCLFAYRRFQVQTANSYSRRYPVFLSPRQAYALSIPSCKKEEDNLLKHFASTEGRSRTHRWVGEKDAVRPDIPALYRRHDGAVDPPRMQQPADNIGSILTLLMENRINENIRYVLCPVKPIKLATIVLRNYITK